jgi:hypothetical protein
VSGLTGTTDAPEGEPAERSEIVEASLAARDVSPDSESPPAKGKDDLVEVDEALGLWSRREREFAQQQAGEQADRDRFLADFADISERVLRPTLEAVIQRLRRDGGDGILQERGSDGVHGPRLTLWMSLEGEISAEPRQDRNPFLQLDADVAHRRVDVWEGDMWQRQGLSRETPPWRLSEISPAGVTERVVGILGRAAKHGLGA